MTVPVNVVACACEGAEVEEELDVDVRVGVELLLRETENEGSGKELPPVGAGVAVDVLEFDVVERVGVGAVGEGVGEPPRRLATPVKQSLSQRLQRSSRSQRAHPRR